MTRVTGELWRDELDLLIDELMLDGGDDLHDPGGALGRVRPAGLPIASLWGSRAGAGGDPAAWADHCEALGAVVTARGCG